MALILVLILIGLVTLASANQENMTLFTNQIINIFNWNGSANIFK